MALTFGGKTYELVEGSTWQQARANAQALGGDLVVINSAEENAFVLQNFGPLVSGPGIWIGYYQPTTSSDFTWVGDSSSYSNWRSGAGWSEPNNDQGVEDYVHMWTQNNQFGVTELGTWNDAANDPPSVAAGVWVTRWQDMKGVAEILPAPTYSLSASSSSVNEGSTATFTLSTTNVASGTSVSYSISGVSSSDVTGGLSGSVSVDSNGQATISVPIVADSSTEGSETLTVTAQGVSASTTINDTSLAPVVPTYNVSASSATVNEGVRLQMV